MPPDNQLLIRLSTGSLRYSELPDWLPLHNFSTALEAFFACAFVNPDLTGREHGCCIISRDNYLLLPRQHKVQGDERQVTPTCEPNNTSPEHIETYVGYVHTHVCKTTEDLPHPGFSGQDFCKSIDDGLNLSVVCNGQDIFMLARSSDRTMQRVDSKILGNWMFIFRRHLSRLGKKPNDELLSLSIWEANRLMCDLTGYTLYFGPRGTDRLKCVYRPQ